MVFTDPPGLGMGPMMIGQSSPELTVQSRFGYGTSADQPSHKSGRPARLISAGGALGLGASLTDLMMRSAVSRAVPATDNGNVLTTIHADVPLDLSSARTSVGIPMTVVVPRMTVPLGPLLTVS